MTDILQQDIHDSVLELTINREDAGNALNNEMIGLLSDSLKKFRSRPDLRCVLIKGSGEKFFVAGGDLKELTAVTEDKETEEMALNGREMLDQIRYFPVPVIAKINGYALGGGAELAMACDYRIACETAKFGFIHSSLGITTAWGGMIDLIESIGSSKALSILIEGKMLDAKEAYQVGIIHEVEKTNKALDLRINALKKIYQDTPTHVIRGIKSVNMKHKERIHENLKEVELDSFKKTWMSDEHWQRVEELLSK